jgi:chemotaxis protein histidine kinase CheA
MKHLELYSDYIGESLLSQLASDIVQLATNQDMRALRKVIGDVISEYNKSGLKTHKQVISHLDRIVKKVPEKLRKDLRGEIKKVLDRKESRLKKRK